MRPIHNITFVKTKYQPLPDDRYKVRLNAFLDDEVGKFGQERLVFEFEITEGKWKGHICNCFVNQDASGSYGINNKMGRVVAALRGTRGKEGEYFGLQDLIGCECFAHIEQKGVRKIVNRIYKLESLKGEIYEL